MMKKVLIMIPSYSLGGGAEKILSNILCNGNFKNYNIDIVEIEQGYLSYEKLPNNVKVINYLYSYKYNKFFNIFLMKLGKIFPSLLRKYLIKKDDYDVEIAFEIMYPDIPFSSRDIKKISWVHGSIEEFSLDKYKWRKEHYKKNFFASDKIIAISKKTKQSIIEIYPKYEEKIKLIYNGYDFENIEKLSKEPLDYEIEDLSICSVGRIEEEKGSNINLEILKKLHNYGYKYHLYFIGSGKQEEYLKKVSSNYELKDYVHFLGYQKNPYKYMKNMKVLLSSSKKEGFPNVYAESMYLGLPFVSTDVGGVEELSQNGKYGKIITNTDEALKYIINYIEDNKKVDKIAMKDFIKNFSLENQIKEFSKLLDS